ncbi:hypothetical protein CF647_14520 [Burkholderia sp. 117]|nr:hypothetical protein CF649_14480 [Burkholderia sp. 136(2017)]PNX16583.1 hypothetical protein CF650_06925 [Burkholderia sp. 129]PNX29029.1 hypothetical protein CF647_14520 [Burkholderia sp. 117]PNX38250.1 hypothetical protein CF648_14485 [Burkholderia sp. 137]
MSGRSFLSFLGKPPVRGTFAPSLVAVFFLLRRVSRAIFVAPGVPRDPRVAAGVDARYIR